ncbi:uncharacterized protein LOC117653257 [Thrips palmi]|uniref:Uncharacterized protein LOC117653257 n=1 Tax=Thrips palmi TaxID=161013 RepID=A0A6P9A9I4_THRPL|nr:uncharacterized protein LOC117653257 [Thrips palmi]
MNLGKMAADKGKLAGRMRWWHQFLSPDRRSHILHRVLRHLRGTKVSVALSLVALFTTLGDALLSESLAEAQFGLRYAQAVLATLPLQWLFAGRVDVLLDNLQRLEEVTARVERIAGHETKERLDRLARWDAHRTQLYLVCSTLVQLTVLYDLAMSEWKGRWLADAAATLLGFRVDVWLSRTFLFMLGCATYACCLAYYTMLSFILTQSSTTMELHVAIGQAVQTGPCSRRWALLQGSVFEAALGAEADIAYVLPFMMFGAIIMPLLSTVEVLLKREDVDWFALALAPAIFTEFIPLCEAGDGLAEARLGITTCAYHGPWLSEHTVQRRMRLCFMQAGEGRALRLRGQGIGTLNRFACKETIRSWFSFVQILINIQA